MNTDFSWPNRLAIPHLLVELLLRERNFGHTHTQKHTSTYLRFSYPKLLSFRQNWFCIFDLEMNTDFARTNVLAIPHLLVELLLRERNFGHTHTQKHHSTYLKCSYPKLLSFRQKSFLYLNDKWTVTLPRQTGWKVLNLFLSYCYESVILVIHTHKSTLALILNFSSPKLLRTRQKWFCIVECSTGKPIFYFWMRNENWVFLLKWIPHSYFFGWFTIMRAWFWSHTHIKAPEHLS